MSDLKFKYDDFERDGESKVRENVALGRYQPKNEALAKEWLRQKGQARDELSARESRAANLEDRRIARSAKNAAWIAAITAIIAAIAAIIAVFYHPS